MLLLFLLPTRASRSRLSRCCALLRLPSTFFLTGIPTSILHHTGGWRKRAKFPTKPHPHALPESTLQPICTPPPFRTCPTQRLNSGKAFGRATAGGAGAPSGGALVETETYAVVRAGSVPAVVAAAAAASSAAEAPGGGLCSGRVLSHGCVCGSMCVASVCVRQTDNGRDGFRSCADLLLAATRSTRFISVWLGSISE